MSLDEERRTLERQAKNDPNALERLQVMNDRVGLSGADADYLLAYLDLCERVAKGDVSAPDGLAELGVLNEAYKPNVTTKTLKASLAVVDAAHERGYTTGRDESREYWSSSTATCP